mmetsp:Transcript_28945/g.47812  ORF Transcript_28945/g.47812 Transcript_28945/m.47812 type:complete len:114 (+) Transcript_28945:180-521(+)|eukprot:CAMPEP_0119012152 /NCGR_PEP_ID=MMETSP1176-20130426/6113_1 /TAXON_ID=265551 /ORGANISM="Synedropsis recta cf, Strain CCMP1620" /LENGTH=113 /DNA_ID=CAMNT_0006965067 /DNA_START=178 /DNA_END=519 /DNA_ORIENTATION=-
MSSSKQQAEQTTTTTTITPRSRQIQLISSVTLGAFLENLRNSNILHSSPRYHVIDHFPPERVAPEQHQQEEGDEEEQDHRRRTSHPPGSSAPSSRERLIDILQRALAILDDEE